MKKKVFIFAVILIIGFAVHSLANMGVFRKIENKFDGEIVKTIELPGDEDITVSSTDSFALISSTKRLIFPPTTNEIGNLYYMELKSGDFNIKLLETSIPGPFAPHGISMFKTGEDTYKVLAVNGKVDGHSIEVFKLIKDSLIYEKTLSDPSMISPNDVQAIDADRFYFTNDHKYTKGIKRILEEYLDWDVSNVVYFDGKKYMEAANGIAYANGINLDRKRDLLYVASSRDFLVKAYSKKSDGTLEFIEDIPIGTGVDNIEVDGEGNLWLGCHPNLLKVGAYEQRKKPTSPSEILKIIYVSKKHYKIENIFLNDGNVMSASTVAAPFGNFVLAGNIMDNKFIILKLAAAK